MKEIAQELINLGNSREKAEGFGMMKVIDAINKLIAYDGDDFSDGEIIDLINDELNK